MPQRDPHSSTDLLDPIYKKLAALQAQVDSLQNLSIPTVPSYDSTNFPQDAVEGQIAVGENDNQLYMFVNGAWRVVGGGADASYPIYQEFSISVIESVRYEGNWDFFYDATLPYSFYFNNFNFKRLSTDSTTTRTALDGDYFTARFRLGPKGSAWAVWILALQDSDFGSLEFSWATVPEDTPVSSPDYPGASVAVGSMDAADNLTFIRSTVGSSAMDQDFYNPTRYVEWFDSITNFRILGEDGDPLTAFTSTSSPEYTAWTADGGSGVWQLKATARDIGHGAKIGIFRMGVARLDVDFFF